MTDNEILDKVKIMTEESDEVVLLTYIDLAKEVVLNRVYPYGTSHTEVPVKYHNHIVEVACYLFNKRGGEGETYHSEAGVNRTYESASVPDSILKKITPYAGVF